MIRKIAGKKTVSVGLDIGTRLIKAAEISLQGSKNQLTKLQTAEIEAPYTHEKVFAALKKLFETFHPGTKELSISLSAPHAVVRFISMPKMKEEDLKSSIKFEAEKYIPFNANEVVIDTNILSNTTEDKKQMQVLLAAAKKNIVESRLNILKEFGYSVSVIDVDSFACFNAFCNSAENLDETKNTALLNLGFTYSNVLIARGSNPFFTRDIQIGAKDIANAFSQKLNIEAKDADRLIINQNEKSPEIVETAKTVLSGLMDELRLSFGYYENQYGKNINEIYISGGVAAMDGIEGLVEENLNIKPLKWNPFAKFDISPDIDTQFLEKVKSQFAVCAGLTIRT